MIAGVLICGGLLLAWLGGFLWFTRASRTAPYQGRHVPFADPADDTDPDGAGYVGQLLDPPPGDPPWLDEDELDAGWWAQSAPPGAVEILTGPDRRITQTGELTVSVLERVREGLLGVPPDGTSASFMPAAGVTMPVSDDPDTTGVQPAAVRTWGKDAAELADELAARYLT